MQRLSTSWLVADEYWKGLRTGSVGFSAMGTQGPILNAVQDLQLPEGICGELLSECLSSHRANSRAVVLDSGRVDYCRRTAGVFQEISAQSGT